MPQTVRAVGIAWFRPEDWGKLTKLFIDADVLPASYDEWLVKAEQLVHQLRAQGHIAEKVYIEPDEFTRWCASNGLDINANARTRFAGEAVARKYQNRS